MRFEAVIAEFAAAVSSAHGAPPAFTRGRGEKPDARRFGVYRNNVAVGLIGALESRYPVVRRLVGADFFRATAGAYVADHKPRSAVMIFYGDDFAEFVEGFEPAREIAYLADVARLENAWVEAYHAAEAGPIEVDDLAGVQPEELGDLTFAFHPAARLLAFAHPAASIWASHQGDADPRAPITWGPEEALATRPGAEVLVRLLPTRGYRFAKALQSGATLAEAAAPFVEADQDASPHLIGLIEAGALSGFTLTRRP